MTTIDSIETSETQHDEGWTVEEIAGEAAFDDAIAREGNGRVQEEELSEALASELELLEEGSPVEQPGPGEVREPKLPLRPIFPQRRPYTSGCYRGRTSNMELELRVDIDGARPMRRLSGDFFQTSGATGRYLGSFIVEEPVLRLIRGILILEGKLRTSFLTRMSRIRVAIPRRTFLPILPRASVRFFTASGTMVEGFLCTFVSSSFRRVELEVDHVQSVQPFRSYDTGLLPSGGPRRLLTVVRAFREAGIEMIPTGADSEVPIDDGGTDGIWTNSELHAAMEAHFDSWSDDAAWRVWMLAATRHELGLSLRGIMFDQQGRQRQGCAVFHDAMGPGNNPSAPINRAQLRTCVHELGHCFNLFHSFHKQWMQPAEPNRLDALSWMHYPRYYSGQNGSGEAAYWSAFPFQFDDLEVIHLRHAFRNDIIMGGHDFGVGAADLAADQVAPPLVDESGLRFSLELPDGKSSHRLGEPVVVELKIASTDVRGKDVNEHLHPNLGYVQVAIAKPNGKTVRFKPLVEHCADPSIIRLDAKRPATYESAYIGYGKDGFYFDQPGRYVLRAVYAAADGSQLVSNPLVVRVRAPLDLADEKVAELMLGDEQGFLFTFLGSDADCLAKGNEALAVVRRDYSAHPLAIYASFVQGLNAARTFKRIENKKIHTRPSDLDSSRRLLAGVIARTMDSNDEAGLDNITLNMTMRQLASAQRKMGDQSNAKETIKQMRAYFERMQLPEHVQSHIRAQTASFE